MTHHSDKHLCRAPWLEPRLVPESERGSHVGTRPVHPVDGQGRLSGFWGLVLLSFLMSSYLGCIRR